MEDSWSQLVVLILLFICLTFKPLIYFINILCMSLSFCVIEHPNYHPGSAVEPRHIVPFALTL